MVVRGESFTGVCMWDCDRVVGVRVGSLQVYECGIAGCRGTD